MKLIRDLSKRQRRLKELIRLNVAFVTKFRLVTASLILCITDVYILLESLNKHDSDSNGNGKTATLYVNQALCTFFASLHDYDEKVPNFTFSG